MKEDILRWIELFREVEEKGLDPFKVNVKNFLDRLKDYLKKCKGLDELLLDAEAINQVSNLIKLQEDWLKHKASSLYTDPAALKLSVKLSNLEALAEAIIKSWHPIVNLDNLFREGLEQAIDYWNNLSKKEFKITKEKNLEENKINKEELISLGFLTEEDFEDKLKSLEEELNLKLKDKLDYHSFIEAKEFKEKFSRAYLTSFLVTRGLFSLKYDPLEERYYLFKAPMEKVEAKSVIVPLERGKDE